MKMLNIKSDGTFLFVNGDIEFGQTQAMQD